MIISSIIFMSLLIGIAIGWYYKSYKIKNLVSKQEKSEEKPSLAPALPIKKAIQENKQTHFDPSLLLSLLNNITHKMSSADENFQEILSYSLKSICHYTKWPIGHIYTIDNHLASTSKIWFHAPYLTEKKITDFKRITEETTFKSGSGIIGAVMAEKKALGIKNIVQDNNFQRRHDAEKNNLKGYFALPVTYKGEVKFIFEFLSEEEAILNPHILNLMHFISNQISYKLQKDEQKSSLAVLSEKVISSINSNENSAETISNDIFALSDIVMNCTNDAQNGNEQIHITKENIKHASEKIKTVSDEINQVFSQTQTADQVALICKNKFDDASSEFKSLVDDLHASQRLLTHIHSIATTTNILAMNASIESARAGIYGQSFRVVAGEVKNLAAQTSDYADNINELFENIISRTGQIQHIMKTTNDEFLNLKFISSQMQDILQAQNQNTGNVHQDMEKLVEYSEKLAQYLNIMLKSFEEGQEKSDQVSFSTQTLATENNKLRIEINKFIKEAI